MTQSARISIGALLLMSCAHASSTPPSRADDPPPEEHWAAVTDRRFIYTDTCAAGPFEVTFPAREIEYGRRMVLMVYGARGVQLDNTLDGPSFQTSLGVATIEEGDHSRCRADDSGDPVVIAGAPAVPGKGTGTGTRGTGTPTKVLRRQPPKSGYDTPASELPQLVEYTGELPNVQQQVSAIAWMPRGIPYYYADEYWTSRNDTNEGAAGFRLRFWFHRPSNLKGLVFRFVDEQLVPDLLDGYGARFAARVAEVRARHEARQPALRAAREQEEKLCKLFPDDKACVAHPGRTIGRIPPAPLVEKQPAAPSANVDWTPGYWSWTEDVGDFVWIDGTYVVRAPVVVAVVAPAPPSPPSPDPAIASEPIETREITATIAPPPAARVEVISAPPAQPGVVWIAGHWRLVGPSWQWVAGSWTQPPVAGERYRSPSVRVRGNVRVYLPGRWIRVR